MKVIFVRHGNTFEKSETSRFIGSRTDLPLTDTGKKQAESAADYLKKNKLIPTIIFHGSLKRQAETAVILAKRLGVNNLIEAEDLKEMDYGAWENFTAEELRFMWPEDFKNWDEKGAWPPNIFPLSEEELMANTSSWLERVNRDFPGQLLLAVTSNGILRTINKILLGKVFDFKKSKVRTGAICQIEIKDGKKQILDWDKLP